MEGANLIQAHLKNADLRLTLLNSGTRLNGAILTGVSLDQAIFENTNLSDVEWERVPLLGDEWAANKSYAFGNIAKQSPLRAKQYEAAARAYRMLSTALQNQGLGRDADNYAYRAKVMRRRQLWHQRRWLSYLGDAIFGLTCGYGHRLWQIILAYGGVVILFALAFLFTGNAEIHGPFTWQAMLDALQISLNAIHGRVFFAQFGLDTAQSWIATFESIAGIGIEAIFVAALIQKLFSR